MPTPLTAVSSQFLAQVANEIERLNHRTAALSTPVVDGTTGAWSFALADRHRNAAEELRRLAGQIIGSPAKSVPTLDDIRLALALEEIEPF